MGESAVLPKSAAGVAFVKAGGCCLAVHS